MHAYVLVSTCAALAESEKRVHELREELRLERSLKNKAKLDRSRLLTHDSLREFEKEPRTDTHTKTSRQMGQTSMKADVVKVCGTERERGRERQRERLRLQWKLRLRQRGRKRETERDRERDRERHRETERDPETEPLNFYQG